MKWEEPISVSLSSRQEEEDLTLITAGPPASGLVLVHILNILEDIGMSAWQDGNPQEDVIYYHWLAESFKHGYAKRSYLGDPTYINITQVNLLNWYSCSCVYREERDLMAWPPWSLDLTPCDFF